MKKIHYKEHSMALELSKHLNVEVYADEFIGSLLGHNELYTLLK